MTSSDDNRRRPARTKLVLAMLAVPALALALFAAGCGSDSSSDSSTAAATGSSTAAGADSSSSASDGPVDIINFDYDPKTVTVAAGSKLEFVNKDTAAHTATADDGSFDTDTLKKGDSATVTLDKPGTYDYFCRFHAFMKATVVVK